MKLLLDENLSFRLLAGLQPLYPGSEHVDRLGLRGADDATLWAFARREGFAIVSKDDDFRQLSLLHGAPPKVVVLAIGNAGNSFVLELLLRHVARVREFLEEVDDSLLMLVCERQP